MKRSSPRANSARLALVEAHEGAARGLETISERLARQVDEIGETTKAALDASSNRFSENVERASVEGVGRLNGASDDIARALREAAEASATQLVAGAEKFDETLSTRARGFIDEVSRRHEP